MTFKEFPRLGWVRWYVVDGVLTATPIPLSQMYKDEPTDRYQDLIGAATIMDAQPVLAVDRKTWPEKD